MLRRVARVCSLLSLPLLALPAQAIEDAARSLKLRLGEFPTLAVNRHIARVVIFSTDADDFPQRCDQLRLAGRGELSPRWPHVVGHLTLQACTVESFDDGDSYLSYAASATFKPGTVTLQGLPVLRYEEAGAEMHLRQSYVIDAAPAQLLKTLRPLIEADCAPLRQRNPAAVPHCRMQRDGQDWSLVVGEFNHTVHLTPDPDNPARSRYSVTGGD